MYIVVEGMNGLAHLIGRQLPQVPRVFAGFSTHFPRFCLYAWLVCPSLIDCYIYKISLFSFDSSSCLDSCQEI